MGAKGFLSSTYIDLVEHRRVATEAMERLGQMVGRMEVFGARPEEPSHACLREIEDSDFFVGIYAHRYGYIPDGSEISITEIEFDHAKKHRKPIFCFLVAENYPWPPKMIEDDPGKSKLITFKQKIGKALARDTFTTPPDLAYKVATALGRFLARENRSVTTREEILPLDAPFTNITKPDTRSTFTSPLELRHIVEGATPDSASRLFDVTVGNPSTEQVLLTGFDMEWHYHHGMCCSTDHGVALRPVAKYVMDLAIDPDRPFVKHASQALYPPLAVPPANESGPSLTTLRIQLHYHFAGRIDWHPCFDWDIIVNLRISDERGRLLPVFSDLSWRSPVR